MQSFSVRDLEFDVIWRSSLYAGRHQTPITSDFNSLEVGKQIEGDVNEGEGTCNRGSGTWSWSGL